MEWDMAEGWHREGDGNGFEVGSGDEDGGDRMEMVLEMGWSRME